MNPLILSKEEKNLLLDIYSRALSDIHNDEGHCTNESGWNLASLKEEKAAMKELMNKIIRVIE